MGLDELKYVNYHVITDSPQSHMIKQAMTIWHLILLYEIFLEDKKHPLLLLSKCEINIAFLSYYML